LVHALIAVVVSPCLTLWAAQDPQQPAQQPPAGPSLTDRYAIRGCLSGSKLTQLDPQQPIALQLPTTLHVTSIRVIRNQVKALDGHQVEVLGTLRGIPGQETGILIAGSENGRLYLGGGDPRLGSDLAPARVDSPTINAYTIKDVAASCTAADSK
jgi:hypothetical protein